MDLYWESHLVHKVDIRKGPPLAGYIVTTVGIWRDIYWKSYFVHMMELR